MAKNRTKGDPLAPLDKKVRKMVVSAMETDPKSSIIRTANGHTIIRASNDETMCISRNSGSGHNMTHKVEADLVRCFPEWDR